MRFVTAVQEMEKGGDKKVEEVSRELWRRIWSEDKDITQPASLSEVLSHMVVFKSVRQVDLFFFIISFLFIQAAKKAGLSDSEIEEALKMATSQEIKDKLKSATQYALDHGVSRPSVPLVHSDRRGEERC